MLAALGLLSLGIMGLVALVCEAFSWPCGRCGKRYRPWVHSCKACLSKAKTRWVGEALPNLKVTPTRQTIKRVK